MHDYGSIEPYNVFSALDNISPPGFAYVAAQFTAQRPVIPEPVYAAVYFRTLEDETASFTKRGDGIE
jgi:hypothetical protein